MKAKLYAIFLVIFLLANTGFIYQLSGKPLATSIALSSTEADFPIFSKEEIDGGIWLLANCGENEIYYDAVTIHLFNYLAAMGYGDKYPQGIVLYRSYDNRPHIDSNIPADSYIFLRSYNIKTGTLTLGWLGYQNTDCRPVFISNTGKFYEAISGGEVVFENGSCRIIRTNNDYNKDEL